MIEPVQVDHHASLRDKTSSASLQAPVIPAGALFFPSPSTAQMTPRHKGLHQSANHCHNPASALSNN